MDPENAPIKTRLFGDGATACDVRLALGVAVLGATLAACMQAGAGADWVVVALAAALGFDLFGGVVVNASIPGKRWYHRPAASRWSPVVFTACHVHPFVLALPSDGLAWKSASTIYGLALLGAATVTLSAHALKRPVGMAMTAFTIGASTLLVVPEGWAWFPAAFLVKLIAAHSIPPSHPRGERLGA